MNKSMTFIYSVTGSMLLLCGMCEHAIAERGVTYSPEQWPTRWSSTMRAQQSGRYPERHDDLTTDDAHAHALLEDDLFLYSPDMRRRYEERRERHSSRDRRSRFEDRDARFRERRDAIETQRLRQWSGAYGANPQTYTNPGYWSYPTFAPASAGYGLYGIDPVLGYPGPGWGHPALYGPTIGYPLLGFPGLGPLGAPYLW